MKLIIYIYFAFTCCLLTAQKSIDALLKQYNTQSIPYISVTELKMLQLNGDVVILDSREKIEFDISHIPSANFVGFKEFFLENISEIIPSTNSPVIVYCTIGIRSEYIAEKLIKAGYKNIRNLYGGIIEWKNNNYKVMDSTHSITENVYTISKHWGKWLTNGTKIYE